MNPADAKALDDYLAIMRSIEAKDAEIAALRDTLKDARDKGLIYWEPNTVRGHVAKNNMLALIDATLGGSQAEELWNKRPSGSGDGKQH